MGNRGGTGLSVFGAIVIGGLSLVVWYASYGYWHSSLGHWSRHWAPGHVVYVLLMIAGVIYGLTSTRIATIYFDAIMAFLLGVPLLYILVLLTQFSLLALGLIPFSAHAYFVTSAVSAALGGCWLAAGNAKAMVKNAAEIEDSEIRAAFWGGAALAAPFAFMTAVSIQVHGHKAVAVWIVAGAMGGAVAAAAVFLFTAFVDSEGSWILRIIEMVFLAMASVALFDGIFHHSWQYLAILIPAEIVVGFWSRRAALRRSLSRSS